ncbi:quinone oxidoreductase family protein [Spirillospora sp. NBC_01491]|uniref:quinone oxidoreductase family protein n=1 Tax=Spirillospora sp. NBC_01491 TaxID=2976007 RepID=UPI002E365163|nr:zinc-binding dehydrogenase [Spirillospora sp. NBC_01491]
MRAVRFHEYGPPEVLRYEEVADPSPGEGEVLVRVAAAGINFSDVQMRAGGLKAWMPDLPLPFAPGHEVVGTVAGTDRRVLAQLPAGGGYAELVAVPEAALLPLPEKVGDHEALALLTQGTVAAGLIDKARIAPGETVLVEAAAGGVGSMAVQLAKRAGARVVAGGRGERDAAVARRLGADEFVDLSRPDGDPGTVQVVLESVGGAVTARALEHLEPTVGRMVLYGNISGEPHQIDTALVYQRALSVLAFATALMPPERIAPFRELAFELAAAGELAAVVGSVLPLSEVAAAHRAFEEGGTSGKTVLVP